MLYLLCPLVVCGECLESGSSGLGVATSNVPGGNEFALFCQPLAWLRHS